ncbi:MAG: methyl-accepting chemotaxis protein [Myxococcota bacterium]
MTLGASTDGPEEARALLLRLAEVFKRESEAARADIDRSKSLIRGATSEMGEVFLALESLAGEQRKSTMEAVELFQNAKLPSAEGGDSQDFSSFVAEANSTLESLTNIIVNFARENMRVTYSVEDLVNELELVFENVKRVDTIADDTAMLAINAALEAARAGELGRGFGVVSSEVRSLSHSAKALNEVISGHVEKAGKVVNDVQDAVNGLAMTDMGLDRAVGFSARVGDALNYIEELNRMTSQLTESIDPIVAQVEEHVSNVMRTLQFEDIVTQVMEASVCRFEQLASSLVELVESAEGEDAVSVMTNVVGALEEGGDQVHMPADQDSVEAGDAFLF